MHDTVADVLAAATQRTIRPLLPRAVGGDDGRIMLLLPGEKGYER